MIIEQNTEFKAMRVLVRYWYKNFSVYELAKEAKISAPMAYKILKKLETKKVVNIKEKKIHLDFNNPFSYSFKLLYDSERLLDLSDEDQNKTIHAFEIFKEEYGSDLLAFMVFGSAASNEQTEKSDIDLIAIVKKKKDMDYRKKGFLNLGKLNIIEKELNEFEKDYLLANDLILNVLMNGIIIFDSRIIRFVLSKPLPSPSNDIILQKKERLELMKERLFVLLKEKNHEELVEQLKLFIIEKARLLFLQSGVIPSSKKFIIDNLDRVDNKLSKDYKTINVKNVKEILQKNV